MFVREKRINGYTYLYLVETVREHGRAKQRIIKNLGRKEALAASGTLERLASSVARYAERAVVLSQLEAGNPERLACKRIGAPLLFGRLWDETGCRAVIEHVCALRRPDLSGPRRHDQRGRLHRHLHATLRLHPYLAASRRGTTCHCRWSA